MICQLRITRNLETVSVKLSPEPPQRLLCVSARPGARLPRGHGLRWATGGVIPAWRNRSEVSEHEACETRANVISGAGGAVAELPPLEPEF